MHGLWRFSSLERVRKCRRLPKADLVAIAKRDRRAHFGGLQTCGSFHACPACAAKIAQERAAEIALAITAHHLSGGTIAHVTYTLRHTRAQRLDDLAGGMTKAWSALCTNRGPRAAADRLGVVGWIKRAEYTHGRNGWHPHLHVLWFLPAGTTQDDVEELADAQFASWERRLVRLGLAAPSRERGIVAKLLDLNEAHEAVAGYLAKNEYANAEALRAAQELASATTKRARGENRTPFQLLADLVADGLAVDAALWREYEEATKGRRSIAWSVGLRVQLLAGIPERSDEQAATDDDGAARLIAHLPLDTWRSIRAKAGLPARVLDLAELYDDDDEARDLLARYLSKHGHGSIDVPPPRQDVPS